MPKTSNSITVAVIEDDPAFVAQIRSLIEDAEDIRLVSAHLSGEDALLYLPSSRPEVVLVDLEMPGLPGTDCIRRLKYALPETQFIVLTVNEDASALFDSLMAGATGYLAKRTDAHRVPQCIREIVEGGSPMSAGIARKAIQLITKSGAPRAEESRLSERERQILDLLARGFLYKEAAAELGIHIDTVRNHVRRIYEKLQARNRTEAVLKYQGLMR